MTLPDSYKGASSNLQNESETTEKPLGSLGQNIRLKDLKTVRWILVVIGLFIIATNTFKWKEIPGAVDARIEKESDPLNREGKAVDQAALAERRTSAIWTGQLASGALICIGVLYLGFSLFVVKFPVLTMIAVLVIYLASFAIKVLLGPMPIRQGLLVEILMLFVTFKGIPSAIFYERHRKELASNR